MVKFAMVDGSYPLYKIYNSSNIFAHLNSDILIFAPRVKSNDVICLFFGYVKSSRSRSSVEEHRIANPVVPSSNLGGFFVFCCDRDTLDRYDRPREERTDDKGRRVDGEIERSVYFFVFLLFLF